MAPRDFNQQESIYQHTVAALVMFPGISPARKINSGWPGPNTLLWGTEGGYTPTLYSRYRHSQVIHSTGQSLAEDKSCALMLGGNKSTEMVGMEW